MRSDMVTAYVRQLLEDMTGVRPEPDEDGDLPIRYRGSCFYLRVLTPEDPYVQNVASATDRYGLDLAQRFGGRALFHEQREAPPVAAGEGMYL